MIISNFLSLSSFVETLMIYYFYCLVSDSQNTNVERTMNKSASQPFIASSQPYNKLNWNPELSGQVKIKQQEVITMSDKI